MTFIEVRESYWESVERDIKRYGKSQPLSLQYDIDISCNGVDYVLKVQLGHERKIYALQALELYFEEDGEVSYTLIEQSGLLYALLEIVLHQGAKKRF